MNNLTQFRNQTNIVFSICSCKNEILVIDYDKELEIADLCIYESYGSFRNKMSFWQKIRHIWQILFNNRLYYDQMILTSKDLKNIKYFLDSVIK